MTVVDTDIGNDEFPLNDLELSFTDEDDKEEDNKDEPNWRLSGRVPDSYATATERSVTENPGSPTPELEDSENDAPWPPIRRPSSPTESPEPGNGSTTSSVTFQDRQLSWLESQSPPPAAQGMLFFFHSADPCLIPFSNG